MSRIDAKQFTDARDKGKFFSVESKDTPESKSPKKSPRKKLPREMELQEGMFSMSLPADSPLSRYDPTSVFGKDSSADTSPRSSPRTSMFVETFYSAVVPGEQWKLSLQVWPRI